jgi:hypothetical protein
MIPRELHHVFDLSLNKTETGVKVLIDRHPMNQKEF